VTIEGSELEYEVHGTGEPVILIHGSVMADTYSLMLSEPALSRFKLVRYRRRGFGHSTHPSSTISIRDQANDCRALMRELNIERAHVVGRSSRFHSSSRRSLTLLAKAARAHTRLGKPSEHQNAARRRPFQRLSDESAFASLMLEGYLKKDELSAGRKKKDGRGDLYCLRGSLYEI